MGVSTDAVLFYGYCWTDDREDDNTLLQGNRDSEWQDEICKLRGIKSPWDDYPKEIEQIKDFGAQRAAGARWTADNRKDLDEYYAAKRAVEEEYGCDILWHCSCDYPMPYVCIEESRLRAARGYPKQVNSLDVKSNWDAKLKTFVKDLSIEVGEQTPRWWLVSHWC